MSVTVRMIGVSKNGDPQPDKELGKAVVADDGTITYSNDEDMLRSLIENLSNHMKKTQVEVAKMLKKDGWSNGYIMIDTGSK